MSIFEELRALDDADEPRSLRFRDGLPLWPFIRWLAFVSAQELAFDMRGLNIESRPPTPRQRLEVLGRAVLRGPWALRRTFDIVMVGTSAGITAKRDDRWFDRINDYFAMQQGDQTLVLDMALNGTYKTPRVPPHVRCYDGPDLVAGVLARTRRPRDADLITIGRMLDFIRDRFPVQLPGAVLERCRSTLVHWAQRLPVLETLFLRFFERARPRVLFVEGASYGNFAHLMTWARAAGIHTAEFQHGLISRTHLAYNYGDRALEDAALQHCLPESLLVYGELWTSELRSSCVPVVTGCPHFSETSQPADPSSDTVVVLSQGFCTEIMVEATRTLARHFTNRTFLFRPHPAEIEQRHKYQSLAQLPNVQLVERDNLYKVLARGGIAIGHSSTTLFEAAGVGLTVFAYDDELSRATLPAWLGARFQSADQLVSLIERPSRPASPDRFFATRWRERYTEFLADRGVLAS